MWKALSTLALVFGGIFAWILIWEAVPGQESIWSANDFFALKALVVGLVVAIPLMFVYQWIHDRRTAGPRVEYSDDNDGIRDRIASLEQSEAELQAALQRRQDAGPAAMQDPIVEEMRQTLAAVTANKERLRALLDSDPA